MNNIKYCSDSLAHDYDLFMPKTEKEQPEKEDADNVISIPQNKSAKNKNSKAAHSLRKKVFTVSIAVFMIGAVFGNIFLRAEISRVSNELTGVEATAAQLKSEQTRLNVELEKKTSVGNLEKQAKTLGMQKEERSQMNYIFTYDNENTEESADAN